MCHDVIGAGSISQSMPVLVQMKLKKKRAFKHRHYLDRYMYV